MPIDAVPEPVTLPLPDRQTRRRRRPVDHQDRPAFLRFFNPDRSPVAVAPAEAATRTTFHFDTSKWGYVIHVWSPAEWFALLTKPTDTQLTETGYRIALRIA